MKTYDTSVIKFEAEGHEYFEDLKNLMVLDVTNGYWYMISPQVPIASDKGVVYIHRYVASVERGEWLRSTDTVKFIDGDRNNLSPSNLQVFGSKAEFNRSLKPVIASKTCKACGKVFVPAESRVMFCSHECGTNAQRKFDIPLDEFKQLLTTHSYTAIGSMFGVSGNAIKKRAITMKLVVPKAK
jgi:hypothetical protein